MRYDLTNPDELYDTAVPPTWEDIMRIARNEPVLYQAVILVERGDLTREQALMAACVSLAKARNGLMRQHIDLVNRTPMPPFYIPGEPE